MLKKLLKRIKQLFKRIKYCKNCRFYIPSNHEISDSHICGFTIQTYTDVIGRVKAKTSDNIKQCEECGTVLEDERKIKYDKCERRNYKNKCVDFKRRNISNWLLDIKEYIRGKVFWINETVNKHVFLMFIAWAILNTLLILKIIEYNDTLGIRYELIIGYIIISLIYFRYAIVINKQTKQ